MGNEIGLKTIASNLGISLAAVSRSIKDYDDIPVSTKIKVLKEVESSGYLPLEVRRVIESRSHKFIGVIVDSMVSPFFGMMIEKFISAFRKRGYDILISPIFSNIAGKKSVNELMIYSHVDALISFVLLDEIAYLRASVYHLPMFLFGRRQDFPYLNNIYMDDVQGGRLAAEYLIKKGAKKLCYLGNSSIECNERRFQGFKEYAIEHDILHVEYVEYLDVPKNLNKLISEGYKYIFCFDDSLATRICRHFSGEDIEVIGFNGITGIYDSIKSFPSIASDYDEMVETTCNKIIELIERKEKAKGVKIVYKTFVKEQMMEEIKDE